MQAVKAASEGDEVYTLGSVGHIFQFLQHNQLYAQHVCVCVYDAMHA